MALLIVPQLQWTHLVAEDADGAGGGHFLRSEPHGGDVRRHAEDEDLRDGARDLPERAHPKQVRLGARDLNPRARAVNTGGYERDNSQPFPVQKPRYWKDKWYVSEHVDHGHPVYSERAHAVKLHEDVADDSVLDPLIRIAQRIRAEKQNDQPSSPVQAGRTLLSALCTCARAHGLVFCALGFGEITFFWWHFES